MTIEQRLRDAHPTSAQYALGSKILLEAADRIKELEGRIQSLVTAGDNLADSIPALEQTPRQRIAVEGWDKAAINDLKSQ